MLRFDSVSYRRCTGRRAECRVDEKIGHQVRKFRYEQTGRHPSRKRLFLQSALVIRSDSAVAYPTADRHASKHRAILQILKLKFKFSLIIAVEARQLLFKFVYH